MCAALVSRGPDDEGTFVRDGAGLAMRRLSIIDLSEAGHMPMSDPRTGRWIAFNGEVYNFAELRSDLTKVGHEFRSETDTEVVLHAYEEWGAAALDRFVGVTSDGIVQSGLEPDPRVGARRLGRLRTLGRRRPIARRGRAGTAEQEGDGGRREERQGSHGCHAMSSNGVQEAGSPAGRASSIRSIRAISVV